MWRGVVAAIVMVVAALFPSWAWSGSVICNPATDRGRYLTSCSGSVFGGGSYSGTCTSMEVGLSAMPTEPITGARLSFWMDSANRFSVVGSPCIAGTQFVTMSNADYEVLRAGSGGGEAVTETTFNAAVTTFTALITEANQYLVLGWILGLLIAGFAFGWKVVQRGTSQ